MSDQLFIPDGETRKAFIKASAGDYPPVRFTYRRATAAMLPEMQGAFAESSDKAIASMAAVLCKRIIGLCIVGDDGQNVPIDGDLTPDRMLQLSPFLFRKIQGIVTGMLPSDPDPVDGTKNETAEDDLKNSGAG